MKKFIIKWVAFLVVFALCVGVCDYGYVQRDWLETKKFENVPTGIQVCVVGASVAREDFELDDYSEYVTFNFGMTSQSLVYDYNLLQNYRNNIKEGATVFIAVAMNLLFGFDEITYDNFASKNRRYYRILPKEYIRQYNGVTNLNMKFMPFIYGFTVRGMVKGLVIGITHGDVSASKNGVTNATATAGYVQGTIGKMNDKKNFDSDGNRIYIQSYIDALYDIIELCKEIGATPVIVSTPLLADLTDAEKKSAPDYYYRYKEILSAAAQDAGIVYADYSEDGRFKNDYSLFVDALHLNQNGAKAFTKIVMEDFGLE